MNRRKYILTTGGVIALAGCSDESDEDPPEDEVQETEQEEEEQLEEASFKIMEILADGETYSKNEEIIIGAVIENTGELSGSQTIEIDSDWYSYSEEVDLEPNESITFELNWDSMLEIESDEAVGELEYTVYTDDDEIAGSLIIGPANFEIIQVDISSNEIYLEDEVDITSIIRNVGKVQEQKEIILSIFGIDYISKNLDLGSDEEETVEFSISGDKLALGQNQVELETANDSDEFSIHLNVEEDYYDTYMSSMSNLAQDVENLLTGYRNNDHLIFEITMPAESEDAIKFDLGYIIGGYLGYTETGMVPAEVEGEITDLLFNNHISDFRVEKEWIMRYLYGDYSVNDVMNEVETTLDLDQI